jgi:hypothetical protein
MIYFSIAGWKILTGVWFVYVISETTVTEARNKPVIHYLHFLTENAKSL